jgi:hypothetical protein
LGEVGIFFNLKHDFYQPKRISIPVSKYIRVHELPDQSGENEAHEKFEKEAYTIWYQKHLSELQYQEKYHVYSYVIHTEHIFPYEIDNTNQKPIRDKLLRPELTCMLSVTIKADTLKPTPSEM